VTTNGAAYAATSERPFSVSGVLPSLTLSADLGPPRSECGVGGLMPWAGSLWAISYVSHRARTGSGTGLYEIDEHLRMARRPESVVGTYANRFVHNRSNQLIIGPHVIDAQRRVRTVEALVDVRIAATMEHLTDPERMVYVLGMEGEFFELDVHTLALRQLFDLTRELQTPGEGRVHFKCGYSAYGRVVVGNNTYDERDFSGAAADGRLAEWTGDAWTILDRKPFVEVHGRGGFSGTIFAMGWDRASAILKVFTAADGQWRDYRLPKASHTFDHMWQTEWPRIREVEHERFLMDCHGMFYELSPWAYGNRVWGIRPISTHLWVIPDFCSFRGMLVLGSDNASSHMGDNTLCAEPQSGIWLGKTDDLWQFGKPKGWGGPWWETPVAAGAPSDPFLMTGFEHKVLHLSHDASHEVRFALEVDFLGNGSWKPYATVAVGPSGYAHHEFPAGFSAHWARVTPDADCTATAHFMYT
jgi:hypothetical protein